MNTYNVVIKDSAGVQQQYGVSASTWQNAIDAAKEKAGIAVTHETDSSLVIVQITG